MKKINCIHQHSCENMPELKDDRVALTVTSPPYWNAIDYDIHAANTQDHYRTRAYANGYADYGAYLDWLDRVFKEVLRVTKPGGTLIFVDYHRPVAASPFRYIMVPILTTLEPFAMDMWRGEIADWLPAGLQVAKVEKQTYFGGLYQKVVITR